MAGSTSGISPSFLGLSRSSGQVTHVFLPRSRLCPRPKPGSSLHLHVLSTPPAFVLSQDQTLREELLANDPYGRRPSQRVVTNDAAAPVHLAPPVHDGSISGPPTRRAEGSNLDAHHRSEDLQVRMLLSFQRPPRPSGEEDSVSRGALGPDAGPRRLSIAPAPARL